MSNDKKTLADVKPGGMVRLGGTPWPEIDAILADAYSAGAEGLPFEGIARRAAVRKAVAALPAQPSPGGQDALAALCEKWEVAALSGGSSARHYVAAMHECAAELKAALAARQPVGEPVAWMTHHDEPMLYPTFSEAAAYCDDDEPPIPLYAAPPAQAVDLDDFKALYRAYVRLLESGRDRIRDLGGACDPVDVMEANDVDLQAARRVIDSKAVGNG